MNITEAQKEIRLRYSGGCYGQAVSGVVWLASACFASWGDPRTAILVVVIGGFFIFPMTELLVRSVGSRMKLDRRNALPGLGMQVAFVLPLSMSLLVPVCQLNINLFYPALMILVGAHYLPFVFMYGMRMFAVLAATLLSSGVWIAMNRASDFSIGAWYAGVVLLFFAALGKYLVYKEIQRNVIIPPANSGS